MANLANGRSCRHDSPASPVRPISSEYDYGVSYGPGIRERKYSVIGYRVQTTRTANGNGRDNIRVDGEYTDIGKMASYWKERGCRKWFRPWRYYRYVMTRCKEAEKAIKNFKDWLDD